MHLSMSVIDQVTFIFILLFIWVEQIMVIMSQLKLDGRRITSTVDGSGVKILHGKGMKLDGLG